MDINLAVAIIRDRGNINAWGYDALIAARKLPVEWESEWLNGNQAYSFIDPPSINKEKSYDDCIEVYVTAPQDAEMLVVLTIWDGDICNGRKTIPRCKFTATVTSAPEFLEKALERALVRIGTIRYDTEQQRIKQARIAELIEAFKADHQ